MFHIVESCPLTKLNGGLSRLHSADEDAVSWLTSYGSRQAHEKENDTKVLMLMAEAERNTQDHHESLIMYHYIWPRLWGDNFVDFWLNLVTDELTDTAWTKILDSISLESLLDVRLRVRYSKSCQRIVFCETQSTSTYRSLGMCVKTEICSDSVSKKPNRPKIWHPFRWFSDRNCMESTIQIKSD